MPKDAKHFLTHFSRCEAEILKNLCSDALFLAHEAQQQVLCANVIVIQLAALLAGVVDHFLGARCQWQCLRQQCLCARKHDLRDLLSNLVEVNAKEFQNVGRDTAALLHQAQENVLRADAFVVEANRLFLGKSHYLAGPVGEAFVHGGNPIKHRH